MPSIERNNRIGVAVECGLKNELIPGVQHLRPNAKSQIHLLAYQAESLHDSYGFSFAEA